MQVVITNMPEAHFEEVEAKTFPGRDNSESYKVPLTRVLYIESTDFRLKVRRDEAEGMPVFIVGSKVVGIAVLFPC